MAVVDVVAVVVVVFVIALSTTTTTTAHPLCTNPLYVNAITSPALSFCTEYRDIDSCCTFSREQELASYHAASGASGACAEHLRRALCMECDPWSAHLFGVEKPPASSTPFMCQSLCPEVYDDCVSQFPLTNQGTDLGLPADMADFNSAESFCEARATSDDAYCYTAEIPYDLPISDPVELPGGICVKTFWENPNDEGQSNTLTAFGEAPDNSGRLFVGTKMGYVYGIERSDGSALSPAVAIDLRTRVSTQVERGLLSLAFHPQFDVSGHAGYQKVYICFTLASNDDHYPNADEGSLVVEEYTMSGNRIGPNPDRSIVVLHHAAAHHNGGDIHFGPADGYLYVSVGDGDQQSDVQDLTAHYGKILRLDVDSSPANNLPEYHSYRIPSNNPYGGNNNKIARMVYAAGFRNPWRFSFDREAPHYLFTGDVGETTREEISNVVAGAQYGWPRCEGNIVTDDASTPCDDASSTLPVFDYGPSPAVVIGGFFYRGSNDPSIHGVYVFADIGWGSSRLGEGTKFAGLLETPVGSGQFDYRPLSSSAGSDWFGIITGFGQDASGELYVLSDATLIRMVEPIAGCGSDVPDVKFPIQSFSKKAGDVSGGVPLDLLISSDSRTLKLVPKLGKKMSIQLKFDASSMGEHYEPSSITINVRYKQGKGDGKWKVKLQYQQGPKQGKWKTVGKMKGRTYSKNSGPFTIEAGGDINPAHFFDPVKQVMKMKIQEASDEQERTLQIDYVDAVVGVKLR
eukprot:TRINITY_DN1111_c1_g1_i1.p1 TRINITY_DN1111_c1_g1~~TRINITY_DN1111_c1_g1_i1.p1  ORF type:complete len:750 (+),score=156.86 TRINITY_DN1111_c1_g1_i1:24-2252(+)